MKTIISIAKNGTLRVYGNSKICSGCIITVNDNSILQIGQGCYINSKSNIHSGGFVSFGDDSICGEELYLRTSDQHSVNGKKEMRDAIVGNHCFLGVRCTVIGAKIGDGCVIGASSLVTKDIENNSLAYGIPATVKKNNITWEF